MQCAAGRLHYVNWGIIDITCHLPAPCLPCPALPAHLPAQHLPACLPASPVRHMWLNTMQYKGVPINAFSARQVWAIGSPSQSVLWRCPPSSWACRRSRCCRCCACICCSLLRGAAPLSLDTASASPAAAGAAAAGAAAAGAAAGAAAVVSGAGCSAGAAGAAAAPAAPAAGGAGAGERRKSSQAPKHAQRSTQLSS